MKFTCRVKGYKTFYLVSLPISLRASLPSLRVLITNQEKNMEIKTVNNNSENNRLFKNNRIYIILKFRIFFVKLIFGT